MNTLVLDGWRRKRSRRSAMVHLSLAGALLAVMVAAAGHGAVSISPARVLAILTGLQQAAGPASVEAMVLLEIRLPRVVLGILVGSALAVAGAALQGLFRNPLADPGLIGVSTGAALAAGVAIVFGGALAAVLPGSLQGALLPAAAFAGGLLATAVVYLLAHREGRADVSTLLLAGVALNAIAGAAMGLLVFVSDDQQLRDLNFWLLGSLGGVTWERLLPALPFLLAPVLLMPMLARPLDALLLGETEAAHLGFRVESAKRLAVILAALGVGGAVALTGVIGFVGLVVPHLVRLALGPGHRLLLPASALLGASLLLLADLLARTVVLPAELPIGIVTSCVGGPFFLWLLVRRGRRAGMP